MNHVDFAKQLSYCPIKFVLYAVLGSILGWWRTFLGWSLICLPTWTPTFCNFRTRISVHSPSTPYFTGSPTEISSSWYSAPGTALKSSSCRQSGSSEKLQSESSSKPSYFRPAPSEFAPPANKTSRTSWVHPILEIL